MYKGVSNLCSNVYHTCSCISWDDWETYINPEKTWQKNPLNKKVLLRERKRHTARRVVSILLLSYPGTPPGGVPDLGTHGGVPDPGTPRGVPDPGTQIRYPPGGTQVRYPPGGYPGQVPPPQWRGGYPVSSSRGGYPWYLTRVHPLGGYLTG